MGRSAFDSGGGSSADRQGRESIVNLLTLKSPKFRRPGGLLGELDIAIDSYIRNIYVSPHIHPKDTTILSVGGDWYGRGGAHISSAHIRALHLFVRLRAYTTLH